MGMSFKLYRGPDEGAVTGAGETAEPVPRGNLHAPDKYYPDDLAAAVNTALLLGMPLLVTGDPGSGKTQLGPAVAAALGWRDGGKFETKSVSQASDVFYVFDVVGRFSEAQSRREGADPDPLRFIRYKALGTAILRAHEVKDVKDFLPLGDEGEAMRKDWDPDKRSVVVIDEVDKAPRDFPNDLLNEIDLMYFRVKELRDLPVPQVDEKRRPFIIFTSNSEKRLPDAFLRRCIYFHIKAPDAVRLQRIIRARLGPDAFKSDADRKRWGINADAAPVNDAIDLFLKLADLKLVKPPGVAELLNWIQALQGHKFDSGRSLRAQEDVVRTTITALAKTEDDRKTLLGQNGRSGFVSEWLKGG
jgi:MoxR-like ATPase